MKNMTGFAVMAMMAGTLLLGATADVVKDRRVAVCMEAGGDMRVVPLARKTAADMFRGIGVRIDWRPGTHACPPEGIVISLSYRTQINLKPGVLAYAKPFEGTHIVLFYDRIVEVCGPARVTPLLSHVLVHEITHILEGTARHSKTGVMKDHWTEADYGRMGNKSLGFDRTDVELIDAGMAVRARRAITASGVAPKTSDVE